MANWFVDCNLGTGDNNGTTTDHAWRGTSAFKTAMESAGYTAGDKVWFKRDGGYDEGVVGLNADIAPTDDATADAPIYFIGCPRAAIPNTTITEADWTNGSTTVDNIVGITCTRGAHQARWATAPNGKKYLITRVVDANTVIIDREYAGTTVTSTDGAFQIDADEDYAEFAAIDDSAWTIKISTWIDDAHTLPIIDFNNETYQLLVTGDTYLSFRNFDLQDSADTAGGILYTDSSSTPCYNTEILGCLFKQASNVPALRNNGAINLKRFTIEGSGAGAAQYGLRNDRLMQIADGAIYNCGDYGLHNQSTTIYAKNINIGVEVANGDCDIRQVYAQGFFGSDIILGGVNGYVSYGSQTQLGQVKIENYGKVLGKHKTFAYGSIWESIDVDAGETPNKKLSTICLKIVTNSNAAQLLEDWKEEIFSAEFNLSAGAHTIKFWVYNETGSTLNDTTAKDNIFLRADYVDSYDDTTEYTITQAYSTEIDIANAADADDWDYLEVSMTLATASKVRVTCLYGYSDATGNIFIDPQPVIT